MTDIKRLLNAMAACAAAIPGRHHAPNINFHGCDAATLQLFVDCGGTMKRYESESGTSEWDVVEASIDGVTVYAYGEHRAIVRSEIDPAKVEAALALAAEAVSS